MADAYGGWRGPRAYGTSRTAGSSDQIGWWAGVAFLAAVILHAIAFLALGRIQIALGLKQAPQELHTAQVRVTSAESIPENRRLDEADPATPTPPPTDKLVDDIDILSKLPEQEMDMKPDISRAQFNAALNSAAASGDPNGVKIQIDPTAGLKLDDIDLPEIGRTREAPLAPAADGQLTIDPGKSLAGSDTALDDFAESMVKKGAGGKLDNGQLSGVVSLDDMIGLPADVLVGKKTMLPGDLLFEYDSAQLRQSARIGLMKLALIVTNNPKLYCWIEGYSDLYGTDAYNLDLSLRRADAVRHYLVVTLHLPAERIVSRGYGKTSPLVRTGSVDEQGPNRRVEIKMRRTPPPPGPAISPSAASGNPGSNLPPERPAQKPPVAQVIPDDTQQHPPAPAPDKKQPVLVKPQKAIAVDEELVDQPPPPPKAKVIPEAKPKPAPRPVTPPKAEPVEEEDKPQVPPKANPIEDDPAPPKASEIDEPPPKALDVDSEE